MWPFRKPKPQPPDRRFWNEDWQRGDLAECLSDDWTFPDSYAPKVGDIFRVSGTFEGIGDNGSLACFLILEKTMHLGYVTTRFRKLRPSHKAAENWRAEWAKYSRKRVNDTK